MVNSKDITNAYIQTAGSYETASGTIILVYENKDEKKIYSVSYDTLLGPDGLTMTVSDNVGDEIRLEEGGFEKAPEFVIKHAHKTLSNYYSEAKSGEGATPKGKVVFTGVVGINDNWKPEP